MRRRALTLILSTAVLGLSLVGGLGTPASARAAVDLRLCGTVAVYVPATALTAGALTVGAVPLVIAAGTTLSSQVAVGANLCFALDLNASGKITGATVTANVTSTINVCGVVSSYVKADADSTGRITIGGIPFVLAVRAKLPAIVKIGANLCLKLTLNGFGQISRGSATINATSTLNLCGVVTAYAKADANSTGSVTIGGRKLTLAIGSSLPASVKVGANLCLKLTLNLLGQVQNGTAKVNVSSTVQICGVVTAYARATNTATGLLTVGGRSFALAAASQLPASVAVGKDLCLSLTLNALGQVQNGTVQLNVDATLDVCGQVTAFVDASNTTNGSLTIGGVHRVVRAGTDLSAQIKAGAYLRLRLKVDVFGRVADAIVLKVGVSLADACQAAASPAPSGSPDPGPGSPDPSGSPDASGSSDPSASPSPSSSVLPGVVENPCAPKGNGDAAGRPVAGGGGIIPDTASLGRTAAVLAVSAVPLLLLLLGVAGWVLQQRRRVEQLEGEVAS
jgi:hypothetical protein